MTTIILSYLYFETFKFLKLCAHLLSLLNPLGFKTRHYVITLQSRGVSRGMLAWMKSAEMLRWVAARVKGYRQLRDSISLQ